MLVFSSVCECEDGLCLCDENPYLCDHVLFNFVCLPGGAAAGGLRRDYVAPSAPRGFRGFRGFVVLEGKGPKGAAPAFFPLATQLHNEHRPSPAPAAAAAA